MTEHIIRNSCLALSIPTVSLSGEEVRSLCLQAHSSGLLELSISLPLSQHNFHPSMQSAHQCSIPYHTVHTTKSMTVYTHTLKIKKDNLFKGCRECFVAQYIATYRANREKRYRFALKYIYIVFSSTADCLQGS